MISVGLTTTCKHSKLTPEEPGLNEIPRRLKWNNEIADRYKEIIQSNEYKVKIA
jgi:hypothetical protein